MKWCPNFSFHRFIRTARHFWTRFTSKMRITLLTPPGICAETEDQSETISKLFDQSRHELSWGWWSWARSLVGCSLIVRGGNCVYKKAGFLRQYPKSDIASYPSSLFTSLRSFLWFLFLPFSTTPSPKEEAFRFEGTLCRDWYDFYNNIWWRVLDLASAAQVKNPRSFSSSLRVFIIASFTFLGKLAWT